MKGLPRFLRHCLEAARRLPLTKARPFRPKEGLADGSAREHDLSRKFCAAPWEHFEIGTRGKTYMCCPKWLPKAIGYVGTSDIMSVWNSKRSQRIRRSVLAGDFRYCVQKECPLIQSGDLPDRDAVTDPRLRRIIDERIVVLDDLPTLFNLCYDESCNLRCPSCRRDRIMFAEGPELAARRAIQEQLVQSLFDAPHDRAFCVNVTGSGDPFASPLFRELLSSIDGSQFPNVRFNLQSNGVLFTPDNWERIRGLHRNIDRVMISLDAATAETYAYTRMGGNWARLLENVAFLGKLRGEGHIRHLSLAFVVQGKNYREMPAFVALAKGFDNIDRATFSLITDWGTYDRDEFPTHAIWQADHPEFESFLTTLEDPIFDDPIVHLGNVHSYRTLRAG